MATGRRHIINEDNGGWAVFITRHREARDHKSDRQKGIRKKLSKILRTRLKREADAMVREYIEK
ncbi:MAG: hypothetical protein LUF01_03910 [Bacteroides sp.]|nr:hypothetical protein [Bacteroides sp.]